MNALIQRFRTYPAPLQWLIICLAVVAVVWVWYDLVWQKSGQWNERAREYEQVIAAAHRDAAAPLSRTREEAIVAFGDARPPAPKSLTAEALGEEVNRVFTKHGISPQEVKVKPAQEFKANEMRQIIPQGMRGERLVTEVRFEADQQKAYQLIADLEASPAVQTVSTVRITHPQDPRRRTVVVSLSVEAWVLTPGTGPGLRGGPGVGGVIR